MGRIDGSLLSRAAAFEYLDSQMEPFAKALELVAAGLDGETKPRGRIEQEVGAAKDSAHQLQQALQRLHVGGYVTWAATRHDFEACRAGLASVATALYALGDDPALVGRDGALALGWMGERASDLAEQLRSSIASFDLTLQPAA